MKFQLLAVILLVSGSRALYDESPDVVKLTPDNFEQLVTNSSEVWIVMFYASWCGWSRVAVPEYSKAACALKGIAKLGALDAYVHYDFGSRYIYNSDGRGFYPRIKIFSNGQYTPHKGKRISEKYIASALIAAKKQAEDKLSEGSCRFVGDKNSSSDEDTSFEITTQVNKQCLKEDKIKFTRIKITDETTTQDNENDRNPMT